MIRDCQNGKIDYIITKSVSRFARNTVECLEYIRSLKAQGIGIFFEEQNIDTLKSDSELYLVIYAGFAQSESCLLYTSPCRWKMNTASLPSSGRCSKNS